jgi:hypothetical protein
MPCAFTYLIAEALDHFWTDIDVEVSFNRDQPIFVTAGFQMERTLFRLFSCRSHGASSLLPDPDFSPRLSEAFRSLAYSLAYPSGSSALLEHPHQEHDEISPGQTLLFLSVPPAHTLSRSTLRKYFLRLRAAGSVTRALGRLVRLWLKSRLRPGVSTQALRIPPRGGHPALRVNLIHRAAGLPGLLSTLPPARVRRDFHPLEKRPAGRTTLIRQ